RGFLSCGVIYHWSRHSRILTSLILVNANCRTGKIPVDDMEQTNVPYIYAIGDILQDRLELTPVAIQAGRLLVQRLYAGSTIKCDYVNVPTTVFTPLEYGACGYSEENAIQKFGEENIEVYHSHFWPLEWTVPSRDNNKCYAKIICNIQDNERVIGFHVLGPNAGEVTQGFAAAMKCGLTKEQLDSTIGIHPVCAEVSVLHIDPMVLVCKDGIIHSEFFHKPPCAAVGKSSCVFPGCYINHCGRRGIIVIVSGG
ncbi:hypothetical protein CIB84_004196, partial [Bambusicola thoracicus]